MEATYPMPLRKRRASKKTRWPIWFLWHKKAENIFYHNESPALIILNQWEWTRLTQVDRSAAYAARWVAKSLVAAGLCRRCLVQVSYAIGVAEPLSVTVDHYGTGTKFSQDLVKIVKENFDLRPGRIVKVKLT